MNYFVHFIQCILLFGISENKLLTQYDYTLYFDEYHFDWDNSGDWHVITADNTQKKDGKGYTQIVACTLHIKGLKKNLCVHTKSEGGFTLKFQDFPHNSPNSDFTNVQMPQNSAHSDLENEFESFLKSQYEDDDLSNIELDFFNDDDWSEINAIWNIKHSANNNEYTKQHKKHNHQQRRLYDENIDAEEEFLGRHHRRRFRRENRGHYSQQNPMGYLSPMQQIMMRMMTMKMYMSMMHQMMHSMGGMNGNHGCNKCNSAQLEYFDKIHKFYEEDQREFNAISNDYDNLLNEYDNNDYAYYYDDDNADRRRLREERRERGRREEEQPRSERREKKKDVMDHMSDKMGEMMPKMMQHMMMMRMMQGMMRGFGGGQYGNSQGINPMLMMMMMNNNNGNGNSKSNGNNNRAKSNQCAKSCHSQRSCHCQRRNHMPMNCPGCAMGGQFGMMPMHLGMPGMGMMHPMMNPMMMGMHGMGMMNPMMMHHQHMMMMNPMMHMMAMGGMHGMNPMMLMMMSNPMMMQQMMQNPMLLMMMMNQNKEGGNGNMNPMLMGYMMANMMKHPQQMMHPPPQTHPMGHHPHMPHIASNGGVGGMQGMAKLGGKINPMFNVNMGYMMGRAVKKCQPLKNGLEICAMYNPMTNQLNVDVKCKNCKKLKKGKPKRLFPKKLSKMIKMLVKQRVFGSAGDDLLGGELERRFKKSMGLDKAPPPASQSSKSKSDKGGKGGKSADAGPPKDASSGGNGSGQSAAAKETSTAGSGVGNDAMNSMANGAHIGYENDDDDDYLLDDNDFEESDLVQFDAMEGNIGYAMWRAEFMDWHNFDNLNEDESDNENEYKSYGEYEHFGNFVHYVDTFEFNWNDDSNWQNINDEATKSLIQFGDGNALPMTFGQRCGHKLPFLNFQLCAKVSNDDIAVFFKKTQHSKTTSSIEEYANVYDDDSNFDFMDDGDFEKNDVSMLNEVINYEFEHSIFHFNNDDDWHEIITSHPSKSQEQKRRMQESESENDGNDVVGVPGQRIGDHDHSATEIELFGHLYRLNGISQCGEDNESPRFCVGVHLGEAIKLPQTLQLPMSKMCNFMYIAKVCLGFDPNLMELKLSIQFQSIHKWKSIARRLLKVIKHLPHKVQRYMKWASKASKARQIEYNEDSEYMDEWYDDKDETQWVISSAKSEDGNLLYWDDSDIWYDDDVNEAMPMSLIKTEKGQNVNRKCMHMMGGRLCFCQFMEWIDSPKYHCHPSESPMFGQLQQQKQPMKKEEKEEKNDKKAAAKISDYGNEIMQFDEGWDAENYFDADYDENNKGDYVYDYGYYFGQNEDEQNENFDNRWVHHRDEPLEMKQYEHPQQQKYKGHNLFIYNNYDDDIEYKQKKYIHQNEQNGEDEEEENDDGESENVNVVNFDSLIEINSRLFWLLSIFAVFFGIFLYFLISHYLKKRQEFMLEFVKQFGHGIITKEKYGFTPINVPLTQCDTSEDEDQYNMNEDVHNINKLIEDDSDQSADEFLSNQLI